MKVSVLKIYTDGSCMHNGKANATGGFAVYIDDEDSRNCAEPQIKYLVSGEIPSNIKGEILAIDRALDIEEAEKD